MNPYADAATISCPTCNAKPGFPCREQYCIHGYPDCVYKVCARYRQLPEPHPARLARHAYLTQDQP